MNQLKKTSSLKILLMHDASEDTVLLRDLLTAGGFEITLVQDSKEAFEKASSIQPNLILLDTFAPGINGFEICKNLKKNPLTQEIPVIFITADNNSDHAVKGFLSGAVDYITKPFRPEEVMARVRSHIRIRNLSQEKDRLLENYQQLFNDFREIVQGTSSKLGVDFFKSLVQHLALSMGLKFAFIGKLVPDREETIQTLAVWANGGFAENFTYCLRNTPCENVLKQSLCVHPKGICDEFPRDNILKDLGVQGYAGVPLRSSSYEPMGLLAVMHDSEIHSLEKTEMFLKVFASRAESEMERIEIEDNLKKSEERLRIAVKERTRELEENRRTLATLIANLPGMVYRCQNNRDWTMDYINGACETLTGYAPGELEFNRIKSFNDIIYQEDSERVWQEVQEALKQKQPFQLIYRIVTKSGLVKWVWEQGRGIFNTEGVLEFIEGFILDITKEHDIDQMKSEFISTAAHELRTPLTTILGYSEIASKRKDLSREKVDKFFESINRESQTLKQLIDDLLDISRIESGKAFALDLKEEDMKALIQSTMEKFSSQFPSHRFICHPPQLPLICRVDSQKFQQVIANLYSNAAKYSPEKTTIETGLEETNSGLKIWIKDEGSGMDPEQVEKVFEKFYRGREHIKIKGYGLGLVIVKKIIEAHKGKVWINSKKGQGTTVSIFMPNNPGVAE